MRRIYDEVDSRGERIELNLYIVGEDAEGGTEDSESAQQESGAAL